MSEAFRFISSQLFTSLPYPTTPATGKTIIITGSNVGLGKEAARHFVRLGAAKVILAVRSVPKGEEAARDITASTHATKDVVEVWPLDMASYASVLAFADRAERELERLDIAILNAGVSRGEWEVFEQDESTITVNVVSTFLLALALLPQLEATAAKFSVRPNLTITASEVHAATSFEERKAPEGGIFDKLDEKIVDPGRMPDRYCVSKLLEILVVRAIVERRPTSACRVTINTVNPGLCNSELSREAGLGLTLLKFFLARPTDVGARTLVHAATQGPETHGAYMSDCRITLPSEYVLSAEGWRDGEKVWGELRGKLEGIRKGVTGGI